MTSAAVAGIGIALLVLALVVVTWRAWGDLDTDTGYDALAGWHVSHGRLPYSDFVYYYGPLAPLLLGLAGAIGGSGLGFGAAIAVGLAIAIAIVVATFAVARTLLEPLGAFLATAITAGVAFIPGNYSYVLPHTDNATLGTLLLLAALLCVARHARHGGRAWLVLLGIAVGLAALTKPEPAVAGWLAVALWLVVRARRGASLRREVPLFVLPALAVPVAVYGAFLGSVSLHRLVFDNLYPTDILRGSPIVRSRMPLTLSSFAEQGGRLVLYAAGAAALVAVGTLVARRRTPRPLWAVAGAAVLVLAAAFAARPEAVRHGLEFAYGWVPAGAWVALIVVTRHAARRGAAWSAAQQVELAGLAVLALLATTTYPNFFPDAPNEQKFG